MFQIVDVQTGVPVRESTGEIRIYATGAEAAQAADLLTRDSNGGKYQPRPIASGDDSWIARERARFDSGQYARPVWHAESWYIQATRDGGPCARHFAHISEVNSAMLAYTPDDERGRRDKQTPIKPGAYLARYLGEVLSPNEVAEWSERHTAAHVTGALKFASTSQQIDYVYRNGPRSCMNNPDEFPDVLEHEPHPAAVYGAGDLAVAYMESRPGVVSARCLVWPAKKRYGRRYGRNNQYRETIRVMLEAAGFADVWHGDSDGRNGTYGGFDGARLLKISAEHGGDFLMPYLDGAHGIRDCGDCFKIGGGDIDCTSTTGAINYNDNMTDCEHCGRQYDADDSGGTVDGESWCERCVARHAVRCEATDELTADYLELHDGTVWSRSYFEAHGRTCNECGEDFSRDDMRNAEHCEDCAEALEDNTRETPTVPHPAQVTMNLECSDVWEIAAYGLSSGLFLFVCSVDGADRMTGTRAECEATAARLGAQHRYYKYEARRVVAQAVAA